MKQIVKFVLLPILLHPICAKADQATDILIQTEDAPMIKHHCPVVQCTFGVPEKNSPLQLDIIARPNGWRLRCTYQNNPCGFNALGQTFRDIPREQANTAIPITFYARHPLLSGTSETIRQDLTLRHNPHRISRVILWLRH